jgi:hypothetical protein
MRIEPGFRLTVAAAACCALACLQLGGCAHAYIDADGNRNVIGFVHLTLPPPAMEPKAADWMRMRTVGLALSRTDIGGALEFGYSDNTLAVIRKNSCVQIGQLSTNLLSASGAINEPEPTGR